VPRPPILPPEKKAAIVLSVLAGETTAAEAARAAGVSGQAISNWKRRFVEAGRCGLDANPEQQNTREQQLMSEINALKNALGDSYLQLQAMQSSLRTRTAPGMPRRLDPTLQRRNPQLVPAMNTRRTASPSPHSGRT
jgi:transposase